MAELAPQDTNSKAPCPFCGRRPPEVRFTKEHVLRAHLEQFVIGLQPGFTVQQWAQFGDETVSRSYASPGSPFDMTVNRICGDCNNGWMNLKVEHPAEDTLVAMIQGKPATIDQARAKAVSTWAAKTASVRALMDRPPIAIPEHHYHHIREQLEPPPGTLVYAAHTEPFHTAVTRHMRWAIEGQTPLAHLTTLQIGRVALYVLGNAKPEQAEQVLPVALRMAASPVIRLWPSPTSTTWPPAEIPMTLASSLSDFTKGFW